MTENFLLCNTSEYVDNVHAYVLKWPNVGTVVFIIFAIKERKIFFII